MTNKEALQLLKESILTTGTYVPSENFKNSNSIALELNGKPIILLGWEEDQESDNVANRLIENKHFLSLLKYEYGFIESLEKKIVSNRESCPKASYHCITTSKQGMIEDGKGIGDLVAIILNEKDSLGFGMCINNSIMKCFFPYATTLSLQVELKD